MQFSKIVQELNSHNYNLQVAQCYPKETADFPNHLSTLLLESYLTLNPDTRKVLVQNLVTLRNKNVITSIESVTNSPQLFPLNKNVSQVASYTLPPTSSYNIIRTSSLHSKNNPDGYQDS